MPYFRPSLAFLVLVVVGACLLDEEGRASNEGVGGESGDPSSHAGGNLGAPMGGGGLGSVGGLGGDGGDASGGSTLGGGGAGGIDRLCLRNWTELGGHCYAVFTDAKNWDESATACEAFGPSFHLATITDPTELAAVGGLITGSDIWIGGTDVVDEGTWLWITNEPWTWLMMNPPWSGGGPSNSGNNEHCVEFNGTFNDDVCSKSNRRLCEYTPP